jgi:ribosomal-protein-alanine N-acetyltransferase
MHNETTRLVIRTFEEADAGPWLALVNDPAVCRFLPPSGDATLETFHGALRRRHAMEQERGYAMWAVALKGTGAFIGQCGLYPSGDDGSEIELAYHFVTASWGHGYGTEAAIAVLSHGLEQCALDQVIALVMPENVGSCRVAERAGMRLEGLATCYGIPGLRKYVARREFWGAAKIGSDAKL